MAFSASGVAASIATESGKEIIATSVKSFAKMVGNVRDNLKNTFRIEGEQMTVLCSDSIQKYSISLTPIPRSVLSPKFVEFNNGVPIRVQLTQTRSLLPVLGAIEITPRGFKIKLSNLNDGELYILDVEYQLEDTRFIDALVERNSPRDAPYNSDDGYRLYEMSAQLKHLPALRQRYYSVNLRDVDFSIDVPVNQDISTTVPGAFREQLEKLVQLSKKAGRSKQFKEFQRYRQLQQSKYGGKSFDILDDLHELFTPLKFKKFVDVTNDFHYSDCFRGKDFYDTPFPTWPKSMKVISRTDLNLDKPAADGKVIYKHVDFISEIEKIFDHNKN